MYKKYKDKGLEIISISADKNEQNWRNAIEKDGYAWIQLLDKGDLFKLYKVSTIPRWFLLDSDNVCIADGRAEDGLVKKIQDELGL